MPIEPAAANRAPAAAGRKKLRTGVVAGVAAGATVLVALSVALAADPFASTSAPPAAEPELTLQPRPTSAPPAQPVQPAQPPQPTTPAVDGTTWVQAQPPQPEPASPAPQPKGRDRDPRRSRAQDHACEAPPAAPKGIQQVADALGVLKLPPASTGSGLLVVNANPWGSAIVDGKEIARLQRSCASAPAAIA